MPVDVTLIPGLTAEQQEKLTFILEDLMLRLERGEPSRRAILMDENPELAEHIARYISSLKFLQNALGSFDRVDTHNLLQAGRTRLGDFQLIRLIGRGGMGVVYEAEQQSLKRRVALKVIKWGLSDSSQQLQRFQREAESAAKLHHTNIVPVFGIGEEDGLHFYAMQFIDGLPLTDVIMRLRVQSHSANESVSHSQTDGSKVSDSSAAIVFPDNEPQSDSAHANTKITSLAEGSSNSAESEQLDPEEFIDLTLGAPNSTTYFRNVARIGMQIADALGYAHEHGILHRDIKPSNLMLDRTGTVWVTDFGLVKIADDDGLTKTGDVLGTVRYMAPEQLEGQSDSTSDLYSLGLTLFELLTLRPAFEGNQHVTLNLRLKQRDVPRPRSLNAAIPRDLETIILKATARDRAARYASGALLVDDLQRFVDDRPIRARREMLWERAWRWSRQNPALSTAVFTVGALLVVIAVGSHLGRRDLANALGQAESSQHRAESNLDLAVEAFDSILNNVTSRGVPQSLAIDLPATDSSTMLATLSDADAQLLAQMLDFYRLFAANNADNIHLSEKIAEAHRRAGAIQVRLGRLAEAEEAFQSSLSLLTRLLDGRTNQTTLVVSAASVHNDLGELALRRGEFRSAFTEHLEARASLLELSDSQRAEPTVRFELARATDLFASIDVRSGTRDVEFGPANGRGRREPSDRSDVPRRPNEDDRDPSRRRPELTDRLRNALPKSMRPNSEEQNPIQGLDKLLSEAADQFRTLVAEQPENVEFRFRLAQCLRHRLVHTSSTGQPEIARHTFEETVRLLEELVARSPYSPRSLFEFADTLTHASRAGLPLAETTQHLTRAVELSDQLATRFPHVSEYQLLLGVALARRAAAFETASDIKSATADLDRSIMVLQQLAHQFRDQGIIQIPLAQTRQQLGDLLRKSATDPTASSDKLQRSREQLDTAIADFESYLAQTTSQGEFNYRTRSGLYSSLAETLTALKLPDETAAARKIAQESRQRRAPRSERTD
jgi:serine/threonine protein kinase